MKVHIIGIGPGGENYLLPAAKKEIENAECLVGAKRLIGLFHRLGKEEVVIEGHFNRVIPYLRKYKHKKKIAVLVSGDPGMYSLLDKIAKALKPQEYAVIPGISTLQLAFAKIGESWHDARVISLHGRKSGNLINDARLCNKVFLFTDSDFPPDKIAHYLLEGGLENRRAIILENLSYSNERIVDTDLKRLTRMKGWGLCAMIIESQKQKKEGSKGKLYGIGIGPGDPKLMTLKAKEILDKVDIIFVPKSSEDGVSCARSIVEAVTKAEKKFAELTFPMTKKASVLNRYWMDAANRIAQEVNKGNEVAFVTIGDPLIYSTYIYLLKTLHRDFPGVDVETVPGISAFNAAASRTHFSLAEGDERLTLVPVRKDLRGLRETLQEFDTVVLMKVGSKLNKIISLLKELGLLKQAILVSRVGHENEKIIPDLTKLRDKKIGYLSVILVHKNKGHFLSQSRDTS